MSARGLVRLPPITMLPLVCCAVLGACTDTADTFPLNAEAKALGPMHVAFVRTGIGRGPVTGTMADGEIRKGEWRVASGGGEAFTFSGGHTASTMLVTGGNVQFVMTGPKTQMLCRGDASASGHGSGQCQTYEGALWAVSW